MFVKFLLLHGVFMLSAFTPQAQTVEQSKSVYEFVLQSDSIRYHCYKQFIQPEKYDSLIDYTSILLSRGKIGEKVAYENLGLGYYHLGKMDSAQFFIRKAIALENEESRTVTDEISVFYLQDFEYFKPLCFDSVLIRRDVQDDMDFYKSQQYPQGKLGLEILKLGFEDQAIRNNMTYRKIHENDEADLWKKDSILSQRMMQLLTRNGYLGKEKIGRLMLDEDLLIWHISNEEFRRNKLRKILETAHKSGDISTSVLLSNIIRTEFLSGKIKIPSKEYDHMVDTLCKEYHLNRNAFYYSFH